MPFSANGSDFIIEGTEGAANANGSFRNVYYSGSISLYGYTGPTNYGYASNSLIDGDIKRFPFALAITNSTDVGELALGVDRRCGQSSGDYAYVSGAGATTKYNNIDRWPFALAITNAADVGDLTVARGSGAAGTGTITNGYGYIAAGDGSSAFSNVIDRFPFALSITNATDVGDVTSARDATYGSQSTTNGYTSGGNTTTSTNIIDRFPFALAITNAADVGDLTAARNRLAASSSSDYGYSFGGTIPTSSNIIDRWPFALAITNAADVGDLTSAKERLGGTFSSTYGYAFGGSGAGNVIERFPFALSITNATDVGDAGASVGDYPAGNQF